MDNPLVQVDPGLFIWTIVTFLVLVALLTKFAWGPLLKALEARQETITRSLDDAEQAKIELQRLQDESAEILRSARADAEAIVSSSRSDADALREELRDKARVEAEAIIREAKHQIDLEKTQALREIRGQVADLSITIASKLLDRNISTEDNQRLVEDTLNQLEIRS